MGEREGELRERERRLPRTGETELSELSKSNCAAPQGSLGVSAGLASRMPFCAASDAI